MSNIFRITNISKKVFSSDVVNTIIRQMSTSFDNYERFLNSKTKYRWRTFKPFLRIDNNTVNIKWALIKPPQDFMLIHFGLEIYYDEGHDSYNIKPFLSYVGYEKHGTIFGKQMKDVYVEDMVDPNIMLHDVIDKFPKIVENV